MNPFPTPYHLLIKTIPPPRTPRPTIDVVDKGFGRPGFWEVFFVFAFPVAAIVFAIAWMLTNGANP